MAGMEAERVKIKLREGNIMDLQDTFILSMAGDTFNPLKEDFDKILNETIFSMKKKESEQAEITIKVKISLTDERELTETLINPRFDYKINSVFHVKNEAVGMLSCPGSYELIWDNESCEYIMRKSNTGQQSLFDKPVVVLPEAEEGAANDENADV